MPSCNEILFTGVDIGQAMSYPKTNLHCKYWEIKRRKKTLQTSVF